MYRILTVNIVISKITNFRGPTRILHSYYTLRKFVILQTYTLLIRIALRYYISNRLYVDCIRDWSVLLVNRTIVTVITVKISYKLKKNSLPRPYRNRGPTSLLFNGIGQPFLSS
jgi:hypothetical protein